MQDGYMPGDHASYSPTFASLSQHQLPQWWQDAKLGIFVHWTMASVPAFAPTGADPFELARVEGEAAAFAKSPYVEWYENSLAIAGSPVAEHHAATYGDQPYAAFRDQWTSAHEQWDASRWAELFIAAGARYCVMVTKHHDGACLWPSEVENPHLSHWNLERDLVGECAKAVRSAGLRFGTYYSGGIDWTFQGLGIDSWKSLLAAIPQSDEFHAYADAHWRELIERYQPDLLWDDIGYPGGGDGAAAVMADFYNGNPDGVINDRFDMFGVRQGHAHADFVTPEYSSGPPPTGRAFEVCRGIGTSFGYNAWETDDTYLTVDELVRMFVNIVADGGNLLLNVGPMANGEIPWAQQLRLLGLGHWLQQNGAAIYASRPAPVSRLTADDGLDVRVTIGDDEATYAIILGRPASASLTIPGLPPGTVELLTTRQSVSRSGDQLVLPCRPDDSPAWTLRITE
jgi:alpha-L-fucosidase